VRNHALIGEADRFPVGTSVWYWTSIEGGAAGETIHHVWLHEGEEVADVALKVGAENWRTQSAKTLNAGSTGDWMVEARDGAGNVLARRAFRCTSTAAD
jgi:hypothetical protein